MEFLPRNVLDRNFRVLPTIREIKKEPTTPNLNYYLSGAVCAVSECLSVGPSVFLQKMVAHIKKCYYKKLSHF